jgi:hypothetical protein
MSPAPSAAGKAFLQELEQIFAMPPGPAKEAARKDWARRMGQHFSKKPAKVKDWAKAAAGDRE